MEAELKKITDEINQLTNDIIMPDINNARAWKNLDG